MYFQALTEAMKQLGQLPNAMFVGQAVKYPGTAMYNTLKDVPDEKKLEFPVAEDFQLGFCTGLSLQGILPISIYPRWNFLLLATNQLVNHLDKLPLYGNGYKPKVIIRTAVATEIPLHPGPQHLGDFTEPFRFMLDTVNVVRLFTAPQIVPAYREAVNSPNSTLLVEYASLYS